MLVDVRGRVVRVCRNVTHLQHLNERNTEVQVGKVTADQTQAEHDTDGHNGATMARISTALQISGTQPQDYAGDSRVGARVHRDLVAGVQDGGETGQDLGHGGREHHVPCREEQGCNGWLESD